MQKFVPNEFQVRTEKPRGKEGAPVGNGFGGTAASRSELSRVVKVEPKAQPVVQQFNFGKVGGGQGDYSGIKTRFGSLATTDAERTGRDRKDRRFTLNELSRESLAVDDEERRVVDQKVKERLAELADEAKREAAEIGYAAGLKKGHEEAYAKFMEEGNDRLARLEFFMATCEQARDQIFAANERFLMEIIFRIGRMVTLRELKQDPDYLMRLTRDLIERTGVRENIRIRMSADDAGTIGMLKEGLDQAMGGLKNLNIEVSDQVKLGGCILETEWNAIDATVETQLQNLYAALVGKDDAAGTVTG